MQETRSPRAMCLWSEHTHKRDGREAHTGLWHRFCWVTWSVADMAAQGPPLRQSALFSERMHEGWRTPATSEAPDGTGWGGSFRLKGLACLSRPSRTRLPGEVQRELKRSDRSVYTPGMQSPLLGDSTDEDTRLPAGAVLRALLGTPVRGEQTRCWPQLRTNFLRAPLDTHGPLPLGLKCSFSPPPSSQLPCAAPGNLRSVLRSHFCLR